jgi:photosystem II stability/assembly factor-like uncharacterized protein
MGDGSGTGQPAGVRFAVLTRRSIDVTAASCVTTLPMRGALAAALLTSLLIPAAGGFGAELRDHLYGVRAMSPTEAWAVGDFGAIAHTADGGATWTQAESGTRQPLYSVDFADARHGWVVGKSGLVLRTEDGGVTWTPQKTPLSIEKHLFKVRAVDARTAWAVGDWGTIIHTTDGGATWTDRSLGSVTTVEAVASPGRTTTVVTDDVILSDISFPDPKHGFIVGEFGTLLMTEDGGATWHRHPTPTEKTLFGVHFTGRDRGWVVGIDGLVMHTADGAHTWTVQRGSPEIAAVEEISFRDTLKNPGMYAVRVEGDTGVIVGDTGMVLTSSDGGRTWAQRELPDEHRLVWMRDVSLAPGAPAGFAVGAAGFDARVDHADLVLPDGRRSTTPAS